MAENQVPVRPASREKVYDVIDGERDYQKATWGGEISAEAGLLLIEEYAARARATWTGQVGDIGLLDGIRKIAGIAVRTMEQHGARPREYHVPPSAAITGEMHLTGPSDQF